MAVADSVLVDILHGEGGDDLEMLPIGGSLDAAITWGLHNGERDRVCLWRQKARGEGTS